MHTYYQITDMLSYCRFIIKMFGIKFFPFLFNAMQLVVKLDKIYKNDILTLLLYNYNLVRNTEKVQKFKKIGNQKNVMCHCLYIVYINLIYMFCSKSINIEHSLHYPDYTISSFERLLKEIKFFFRYIQSVK